MANVPVLNASSWPSTTAEYAWGGQWLPEAVDLMVRVIEAAGATVIAVGAGVAFVRFVIAAVWIRRTDSFVPIRLGLGRFLTLGLEFQLAGDILRTAVAPTMREIGELAAIAAIRTALNFFLGREIRQEREELARRAGGARFDPADDAIGRRRS